MLVGLRVGLLFVILAIVTAVANQDRGIPWVGVIVAAFLVFWTFVLNRTRFGRHIYAVGGNQEAARRAGINVDRDQDRLLRAVLVHGGGRRHRARLAAALGRHELGRRPDPALLDRRGGHRRHVAVRRSRPHEERDPRRARDRLDRQRARPARPLGRARSSSSPAPCCCSPSRSTRSRGRGAPRPAEHDGAPSAGDCSPRPGSTRRSSPGSGPRTAPSSSPSPRAARRRRRPTRPSSRSRARTAPTRRCSPTPRSTWSTSRCRTRCTCRGRSRRCGPASTCSARSR